MTNPKVTAWSGLIISSCLIGLAIFLSAGTIHYWQAWLTLAVGAVCSTPITLFMMRDPALLASRSKGGPTAEQRPIQKIIVMFLILPTVATFIVPGLDRRYGWSNMPAWLCIVGEAFTIASFWMAYRVFKENRFGSSTVEVVKDQKVVSTGPYAIVRNPMYSVAVLYFISIAFALGSWWALIPAVLTLPAFVWRLLDEEKFLAEHLPGYAEYRAAVRWHLIPGVF